MDVTLGNQKVMYTSLGKSKASNGNLSNQGILTLF